MNDRQKKKLYRKSILQIKKLQPKKDDVVVIQPNINEIDASTFYHFLKMWVGENVFGEANAVIIPCPIRMLDKEHVQKLCDTLQKVVNEM